MPEIPRDFVQSHREPFSVRAALGQSGVAFAAGVLAGLGHAPFSLIFLSIPGFAAIFWLIRRAATPAGSTILGFAAGAGYFATTLFWITEPFFVDAARHAWMAPFALVFLAGGLALFWGAAARLARWLAGHEPSALALGVAWTASLTLAEFGRTYLLTGFPWAMPGYIWTETEFAQLAAVTGPHGLNFLTIALATALTGLAFRGWAAKVLGVVAVAAPAAIIAGLGQVLPPAVPGEGPMLRLIQPNAPQHLKWRPDMVPVFYQRSLELTSAPSEDPIDIVIWPETSLPTLLNNAAQVQQEIGAAAGGAEIVAGAIRRDETGPYNTLILMHPMGFIRDQYDKHHLVPFGEYVPLMPRLAALGWRDFVDRFGTGFQAGAGPRLMSASKGGKFQPLICYEAIFPHEVAATAERPDWLLQITNDAWFGNIAGPYQHLVQARMRAIEQGLPLVRAANTGISAVIDPRGRILDSLPLGVAGKLDARLPAPLAPTAYAILGDWPALGLVLLCGAATLLVRRRGGEESD